VREISLKTERKTQLIEITDLVREALDGTNGASAALVYVPHTTAGVAINERIDPELVTDLENAFQRVVGDDWEWKHDDADGPNAPSHARAHSRAAALLDQTAPLVTRSIHACRRARSNCRASRSRR